MYMYAHTNRAGLPGDKHTHIHIHTHTYKPMYVCVYTYVYVCIYTYIYAYIYTYLKNLLTGTAPFKNDLKEIRAYFNIMLIGLTRRLIVLRPQPRPLLLVRICM